MQRYRRPFWSLKRALSSDSFYLILEPDLERLRENLALTLPFRTTQMPYSSGSVFFVPFQAFLGMFTSKQDPWNMFFNWHLGNCTRRLLGIITYITLYGDDFFLKVWFWTRDAHRAIVWHKPSCHSMAQGPCHTTRQGMAQASVPYYGTSPVPYPPKPVPYPCHTRAIPWWYFQFERALFFLTRTIPVPYPCQTSGVCSSAIGLFARLFFKALFGLQGKPFFQAPVP